MDIKIIASTAVGQIATKNDFEMFGGRAAGVCYMAHTFDEILNEDKDKTQRRIRQTKVGGHHSVYEHGSFSLYLDGIPKIVAMLINNEKQYTTSEKYGWDVIPCTDNGQMKSIEEISDLIWDRVSKDFDNQSQM